MHSTKWNRDKECEKARFETYDAGVTYPDGLPLTIPAQVVRNGALRGHGSKGTFHTVLPGETVAPPYRMIGGWGMRQFVHPTCSRLPVNRWPLSVRHEVPQQIGHDHRAAMACGPGLRRGKHGLCAASHTAHQLANQCMNNVWSTRAPTSLVGPLIAVVLAVP